MLKKANISFRSFCLVAAIAALQALCQGAYALQGKFGSGYYEFYPSEANTEAEELPISGYRNGLLVFQRNDSAFTFSSDADLDMAEITFDKELTDLKFEGTFAYDEDHHKIYYVRRNDNPSQTQIYEADEKDGKISGGRLMKIRGVMAEKNQIKGSTLAMGRTNFSHPGAKGFHNLAIGEAGSRLYFSGDFRAGAGDRDIYYIDKDKVGDGWSRPRSVADTINTGFREDFPLVVGDTALFFSSNRDNGFGDMDIYVSKKHANASFWGPAVNLGPIFNSAAADYNVAYNKRSMYFISNRMGGPGLADIYMPTRYNFEQCPELPVQATIEEPKGFNWVLFFFDYNKTDMKPEYEVQMTELFNAMMEFPGSSFVIAGYTDSRGSDDYNQKLSQKRAEYIRQMLISRGLNGRKIRAVGHGKNDPIVPDARTEEEHEQNRRVEIKLID